MNTTPNGLTITIGRNIGNEPMMLAAWRSFRLHVFCIAVDAAADDTDKLVFQYHGENKWDNITEESYKVEVIGKLDVNYIATQFIERLQTAAERFMQDAIAYTLGASVLVSPNQTPTIPNEK